MILSWYDSYHDSTVFIIPIILHPKAANSKLSNHGKCKSLIWGNSYPVAIPYIVATISGCGIADPPENGSYSYSISYS